MDRGQPLILLALACWGGPGVAPSQVDLAEQLGTGRIPRAELAPVPGPASPYPGYTVQPVSLQVYADWRASAALWLPEGEGPFPAVLVAHGHFGEGKSSGEAQAPAHALAANGYVVLAVDTPGVEEGARHDRQLHFDIGQHHRHLLASMGTSSMAVQLEHLQAGLDYLESLPQVDTSKIGATGASGGAVQSLYLMHVDERVQAAALASFVPMPSEARAGGCACDAVPGWPGPDPSLLAATPRPTLWMSEVQQERPAGLPRGADFQVIEGPHGYEPAMIQAALDFFEDELGGGSELPASIPYSPPEQLRSQDIGRAGFADLVAGLRSATPPRQDLAYDYTLDCSGKGERVLLLGGGEQDREALAGFEVCALDVPLTPVDLAESLIREQPALDGVAGALLKAHAKERPVAVYAVRGWGLAAERAGLAYLLRDPLVGVPDWREGDPAWIHGPGVWSSADLYPSASAVSSEPGPLLESIRPVARPPRPAEDLQPPP